MAQFEEDAMMMGGGEVKTGKAAIAERKKKRREGQVRCRSLDLRPSFSSPYAFVRHHCFCSFCFYSISISSTNREI